MNPKNKKGKRLTSAIMAVLMSVSATITPVNSMASEVETFASVESTMEETTLEEQVQVAEEMQEDTETQTAMQETQAIVEQTTEATVQTETESTVVEETETTGENAEESEANETRGPDKEEAATQETEQTIEEITETETTPEELPSIDLADATKEEILSYIEAIGGNDSDAFYAFVGSLSEDDYRLVWMAQYGGETDQLAEKFDFDYDGSSDLEVAKYIHKLTEDELGDFVENMTFEQYRRYLSVREMMAEMDEKDFSDVVDGEEFDADRTWDYESYDAFAESLTGVSLQRTEQNMQFYNTYVDPSQVQAGVTTIDGLLDSNADWYSNDYILGLNPEMFKETVPVYYGSDGNYYVVSTVPTLNGIESADYQPATNFYNGSVEAQAFTDIEYLGNGVYRIPNSRYQYCFTEQYVSDMGTLYGISFGLRIQVLYGFPSSDEITIAADVVYPDMTERFLPAVLNLSAGTATVRVFNDDYDDSADNYLVSASVNRGASIPDSVGSMNNGKVLQFVVNDANAVGSLDILIGYNATSKYSMAAEVTTQELYASQTTDADISLAAEMYNGAYLKLDKNSVPKDLAVGDKFIYANTGLTIVGVNTATDGSGATHVGASVVPTHDSQSFCFYNGKGVDSQISSWFKTQLNTNSADPGYMVQMTTENISARASYNGSSVNLGGNQIFGYVTDGLGAVTGTSGNTLNLEGTNVLLACMHAWGNESATTPQDIVTSVSNFTGRTQMDYAADEGFGHYHPNVALQCTEVHDGGDGYTYATFKVVTSMLHVGGIAHAENYQCAFSTLRIAYPSAPKTGYLQIHKSSSNPEITNGNSCYSFDSIDYGVFTDKDCVNNIAILNLDANGYSDAIELNEGTYYVREADATPESGYQTNGYVYTVQVTAGTTADSPVTCETTDTPLNDPFGIQINKINGDGTTTADLSGAEYTIKYYAGQYTMDTLPAQSTTTWVIQTVKRSDGSYYASLRDECVVSGSEGAVFGKNRTGNYIIPLGTITVEETKAPTGFAKDGATVSSTKTGTTISGTNNVYLFQLVDENSAVYLKSGNVLSTSVNDETAVTLTYAEVQNKSGIAVQKYDVVTNGASSAGLSLEGIKFAIVNNTGSDIVNYAGQTISNGCVAQIITTNADGYATTGKADLPVGKYTIRELRADASFDGKNFSEGSSAMANEYYQWKDNQIAVTITDENAKTVVNAGTVYDIPVRGDIQLVKKNSDTGETLAYIPFKITNNATGETHYILTNADGNFTSAIGKTNNTNANDKILSQYGEKDVIPQNVIDSLAKDAGLWFGMGSEGTMTDANDSFGALVYGTYTIIELKTEATRSMKMYTNTFTIDTDGKVLDLGTVNNIPMSIRTALVDVNGEHFTEALESVTLTDTVAYKNLDIDKTYTLTGTLYVKEGDALTELLTETVDFTPTETNGTQDVTFTFDASALVGKSVVAFEELSLNGEFCAEHKDKNDENQTVVFPGLKTTARDSQTDDHVSNADDSVTIIDTVEYSGLHVGNEYTITGTLMDQKTGKAVLDDDGNEIIASKVITATESNGSVEIEFQFAGVSLAGKTIVVFENLDYEGKRYAVHADLNDKNQTIYFPSVKTKAVDKNTGLNQVKEDSNVMIVDTVTYTGLQPGKTYTMTGMLMSSAGNAIVSNGKRITASTEFVPTESDGSVDVVFNFDATNGFGGRQYVFYEYLSLDGVRVAAHTDVSDTNQIIYIPNIKTTLIDSENGSHNSAADPDITLIDTVRYNGVEIGRTYTVTGTLVDKETGKEIVDDAGSKITASAEFTAEKTNGTVDVTFVFSGVSLAGKTIVAYEHMYTEGREVAVHTDIEDAEQTVYIPKIRTHAKDATTETDHTEALEKATIIDTVTYSSLLPGKEYTIKGTLMNKETSEAVLINGEPITAEKTFVAEKSSGSVDLLFTFDASVIAGTTVVAFESMKYEGIEIAVHADIEDEDQTVYIPDVRTTATALDTKDHVTGANEDLTITDEVVLTGLKIGNEYTVKGVLMDQFTKEELKVNGESILAEETFIADAADMTVTLTYTLDASALAGTTTVVYETLYTEGKEVGKHHEINDEGQTVYIPEIHTTAVGEDTQDHIEKAKEEAVIVDTVSYESLEIGKEYTMRGTLVDKETGEPILVDGEKVTAEETFVAEAQEGSIDITFTFNSSVLAGKSLVAFEKLYTEEKEVAAHADIEDEGQTVRIPEIHTTATDKVTGDHDGVIAAETTVLDEVFYTNLLPGKEYTVKGTLMVKETGEPLTVDGKEVTAEKTFLAEEPDGSIILEFTFNSLALAGKHVVAFEDVEYEDISIGTHANIEDEEQTISYPSIHTTAADQTSNSKTMVLGTNVTLVDTVTYTGLTVGKSYVVKGTVMDKASGQPIGVTAETTFTADATDGSAVVTFTFDTTVLQGKTLVVFETLYDEQGNPIVDHSDLNDEDQTVSIPVQPEIPPVVTGDDSSPVPYAAGLTVAFLAAVVITIILLKRKKS